MYIKSAEITNIRSIDNFKIDFENPAGWHVLIGDNGSGKSTIIRSIALALVGPDEAPGLRADWRDWLSVEKDEGKIELKIEASAVDEKPNSSQGNTEMQILNVVSFKKQKNNLVSFSSNKNEQNVEHNFNRHNWSDCYGWFSAAYGPYRRFTGGDTELDIIYSNQPKLGAHLSALNEAAALTEVIRWLVKLNYQEVEKVLERLEEAKAKQFEKDATTILDSGYIDLAYPHSGRSRHDLESDIEFFKIPLKSIEQSIVDNLKTLINSSKFLPNDTKLEKISSEGVFFKNSSGNLITINQLSDGYRSILSLTFELIRQLIRVYGENAVFENILKDDMRITLPGVVLIDEIDAHLHPTWQTKIGQWFLKYFPNLQFIVTTHSPLVCRAAIKGTIWKLAEPGTDEKSKQITGIDKDRIVYGNLVEAYGTGAFEEDVSPSENSEKMRKELADLSKKSFKGVITDSEKKRMNRIQEILPTS